LNFKIQITVDENQSNAKKYLKKITDFELQNIIVNLGAIPSTHVNSTIEKAFATLNPSFLESFGLTYLEAASKNKLVLASDLDFVRETMKDAAIYFNPFKPETIVDAMIKSTNEEVYLRKVKKGREIVKNWPTWNEIANQYIKLIEKLNK
jgi:glycosyltransferase involved in cell wall biosynthesis